MAASSQHTANKRSYGFTSRRNFKISNTPFRMSINIDWFYCSDVLKSSIVPLPPSVISYIRAWCLYARIFIRKFIFFTTLKRRKVLHVYEGKNSNVLEIIRSDFLVSYDIWCSKSYLKKFINSSRCNWLRSKFVLFRIYLSIFSFFKKNITRIVSRRITKWHRIGSG